MKILFSGIGGVGGYFGGKILQNLKPDQDVYFYARPQTASAIQSNGLIVETSESKNIVHPAKIYSDPEEFGTVDLVVFCIKSYDLEENLKQVYPCIDGHTRLLSLLNGIDNEEKIKKAYPLNEVWNGFAFVFAQKIASNHILENGNFTRLFFGLKNNDANDRVHEFNDTLKYAKIEGGLTGNIRQKQWEKFFFISTFATFTSYYNKPVGSIFEDEVLMIDFQKLMNEFVRFANQRIQEEDLDFRFKEEDKNVVIEKAKASNPKATTSMQRDFQQNKKTELEALTGIVAKSDTNTPLYQKMYKVLKGRSVTQ